MNRSNLIKITVALLVALALAYLYFISSGDNYYNWTPNFRNESKDPYGGYLFYELVKAKGAESEFVEIIAPLGTELSDSSVVDATYFFLGENWYYSDDDIFTLSEFVAQGNSAFIISRKSPYEFVDYLLEEFVFFNSREDSIADLSVWSLDKEEDYTATYKFISKWKAKPYEWIYADSLMMDEIDVLGQIAPYQANFFEMPYGAGSFYFHLTPLAFTNFYLKEEDKLQYADLVFETMGNGTVYWDDFSHLPYNDSENSVSPLSFVLSEPSLRAAWYLLLAVGLIYLLFYTRRRRRAVPVLPHVANTSIEFVETIGGMYYHQQAHLKIIRQQHHLFLSYIRNHYNIPTNKIDDDFISKVSLKSGISSDEIDRILRESKRLELKYELSTKDLIDFNQLTDSFYQKCK